MKFEEFAAHDGLGLADLIRRGEVSPAEVAAIAIARLEAVNPALNAVVHRMDEAAQRTLSMLPEGPFRGVPFLLKDLLAAYAGVPMACGSRFLRDFVPAHDSEMVRRYRGAGFVTLGKTNTPEFGLTPFTEPVAFGTTRNPWDLGRTAGGSSGGSAAAVAARIVPIAGGGDGGGSIRIPASCCGLFGLKPTRGRTPMGPDRGEIWQGAVVEHVLTRSVRDSAAVLDAVAGADVGAPYIIPPPSRPFLDEVSTEPARLRIAWTSRPLLPSTVDPEVLRGLEATVRLLKDLGHVVVEATPSLDGPAFARAFLTMICGELRADLGDMERLMGRRARAHDLEAATWALALLGDHISAARFAAAVRDLQLASRGVGAFFQEHDVLLTPTLATPPVPHGALQPPSHERAFLALCGRLRAGWLLSALGALERAAGSVFAFMPWTAVFNMTGQPAMSVPLHWSPTGLPIGMHFVGRFGEEGCLLQLAGQLERARPWADRWPPPPFGPATPSATPT